MKKVCSFLLSALILITFFSGTASAGGFSEDPDAVEQKLKSVLMLEVYSGGELIATGSGFCAFDNRTLVTNYHVIKGADSVIAYSDSGDPYFVFHVLTADADRDIAILSFFSPTDLVPLSLNTDGSLRRAEKVVAIGSPLGITNTVAAGIISGILYR
ncbi:MAG: serine protease [Clostridia bacterium]|nr:serine protease [Clostridia bacterium]